MFLTAKVNVDRSDMDQGLTLCSYYNSLSSWVIVALCTQESETKHHNKSKCNIPILIFGFAIVSVHHRGWI